MKRTRVDHSGLPKSKLPPVPEEDLILYHWSPSSNRAKIEKYGLRTHRKTLQGDWRPPYICFSADPVLAWGLSGRMYPEIAEWDLWAFNMSHQTSGIEGYEICTDTYKFSDRPFIKEYRIYSRVYKRDLDYIATRRQ